MKDVIKAIVNKYGSYKLNYAVVTISDSPSVRIRFDKRFPSDTELSKAIQQIPLERGQLNLDKALKSSQALFSSGRPKSKKVLVVVIDKSSDSLSNNLKETAKVLEGDGIRVIPVAFGNSGDINEVSSLTTIKDDALSTRDGQEPTDVAKKIMDRILDGRYNLNNCVQHKKNALGTPRSL